MINTLLNTPSGLLSDRDIYNLCVNTDKPMISPFSEKLTEKGKISYGLSSYGYDATCARSFKIFTNVNSIILDPKALDERSFIDYEGDVCIIPPNGFVLTHTKEYFCIPEDVLSICLAKSTYARIGLVVGVTPLEPGWEGSVTIEISNTTNLPAKIYADEGICQFLFLKGASTCQTPYNKRGGKYMHQQGVVLPKILK